MSNDNTIHNMDNLEKEDEYNKSSDNNKYGETENTSGSKNYTDNIIEVEDDTKEKSNYFPVSSNKTLNWTNSKFHIENPIRITYEFNLNLKVPVLQDDNSGFTLDEYARENNELKKTNEILEREINLLKSLILINNLNLNTSDFKSLYKENYFVERCNDDNLSKIINDDKLYNQQENLHVLQLKINNLKKRLDLFKKEFEEDKEKFTDHMDLIHNKIMEYFNSEIKMRKTIEDKVSSIKKLI